LCIRARPPAGTAQADCLLTFGYPPNVKIEFGRIVFGAEPPELRAGVEGPGFAIVGAVPDDQTGDTIVYGLARNENHLPQVWRARTADGITFTAATMLYQVPAIKNRWLAGALADHDGQMPFCRYGRRFLTRY